jgi:hypothetical protein
MKMPRFEGRTGITPRAKGLGLADHPSGIPITYLISTEQQFSTGEAAVAGVILIATS